MNFDPSSGLLVAGSASLLAGFLRPLNPKLRLMGFSLLVAGGILAVTPALADQHKIAADNAQVDCIASKRDLTRISLVGDQFASVSKTSTGYPYNDFSVVHEPVRGDIYISIPETYAPRHISFFGTTKKGYVYKFVCQVTPTEAQQVFVSNPALAQAQARAWETKTDPKVTAVRLIQAMYQSATIDGYEVRQPYAPPVSVGALQLRLIAEYRGAALKGKVLRIENKGQGPVTLKEADIAPQGTLGVSIANAVLAPGQATTAYLVGQTGD